MLEDTFANRLKKALDYNNMRPVDLANKTKISKALISNYLKGSYKAKQDKLYIIAEALNVSEAWLMGYDVDMDRDWLPDNEDSFDIKPNTEKNNKDFNELDEILFSKAKDLTDDEKRIVLNVMDAIKKDIDKENK